MPQMPPHISVSHYLVYFQSYVINKIFWDRRMFMSYFCFLVSLWANYDLRSEVVLCSLLSLCTISFFIYPKCVCVQTDGRTRVILINDIISDYTTLIKFTHKVTLTFLLVFRSHIVVHKTNIRMC